MVLFLSILGVFGIFRIFFYKMRAGESDYISYFRFNTLVTIFEPVFSNEQFIGVFQRRQ